MGENGKRLIDQIVAAAPTERRSLEVPEWGTTLYFAPLTKADMDAAMPDDDVERPKSTASLFLLVYCARDKDGKRVFKRSDIEALRTKADLRVLTRVESFMWGTLAPTDKEADQELEANPPSASA